MICCGAHSHSPPPIGPARRSPLCELVHTSRPQSGACWLRRINSGRLEQRDQGWQPWTTSRISSSAALSRAWPLGALSLGLGGGSVVHAGVPLPVVAETTGMPSLAAVVKRIAPSVVIIEGRGRLAAKPGTKQQAGKGIALAARNEIHTSGSGVVFDARRGLIITNSHIIDHADEITVKLTDGPRAVGASRRCRSGDGRGGHPSERGRPDGTLVR
jgi:hypothetical protein